MSEGPVIQWNPDPPNTPWRDMAPWKSVRGTVGMQHVDDYGYSYDVTEVFFRVKPDFEPGFYRDGHLVEWCTQQPGSVWRRVSVTDIEE